jgi:hypothetical protein
MLLPRSYSHFFIFGRYFFCLKSKVLKDAGMEALSAFLGYVGLSRDGTSLVGLTENLQ